MICSRCVGAGSICEDQVDTFEHRGATIAIVADGAGGMGGGLEAASTAVSVIRAEITRIDEPATPAGLTAALIHADAVLERRSMCGESTGLVVAISEGMVFGASVGDSEAALADAGVMTDLTAHQRRKPLLGSGSAMPVAFDPVPFRGTLVAGTDGLFKYCVPKAMLDILSDTDGEPNRGVPGFGCAPGERGVTGRCRHRGDMVVIDGDVPPDWIDGQAARAHEMGRFYQPDEGRRPAAADAAALEVSPYRHLGVSRCATASRSLGSGAAGVRACRLVALAVPDPGWPCLIQAAQSVRGR